jgi:maltose alpha-D-glucosyltransferase/alpha-amylase
LPTDEELENLLKGAATRLARSRWSADKEATAIEVHELFRLFEDKGATCFACIFSFPRSETRYFAPLFSAPGLAEAETDKRFIEFAVGAICSGREVRGRASALRWEGPLIPPGKVSSVEKLGGDTTNAVVKFKLGKAAAVFKSYRTVDEFNPEPELLSFLSAKGSKTTPRVLGTVSFVPDGPAGKAGRPTTLCLLSSFGSGVPAFPAFAGNARRSMQRKLPPHDCIPARLGIALGDLHHLLSTPGAPPDIRPEEISADDIARWRALIRTRFGAALEALPPEKARSLADAKAALDRLIGGMDDWAGARKLRTHQDLHLGQVLISRGGFKFLDFEGEPLRKGPERIEKLPPERDVATMLRSVSYAAAVALRELKPPGDTERLRARSWEEATSTSFIEGYLSSCPRAVRKGGKKRLLSAVNVWMVEKALYEIAYEAKFRPEWVDIPLEGFLGMIEAQT